MRLFSPLVFLGAVAILATVLPVDARVAERRGPDTQCRRGVCFYEVTPIGGEEVPLAGLGHLTFWGFSVYTAAFYADLETIQAGDYIDAGRTRLVLVYSRSISRDDFIKSTRKALEKNPDVDMEALADRIERLNAMYVDVERGDYYEITYTAGGETEISLNGEVRGTFEGEDFALAFFGIWLGEEPLSDKLREELLGIDD